MLADARRIYRESLKPADSRFNLYFARPLAAPLVAAFARTRVTPNQVTFMSLGVMLLAVAGFIALPGLWGVWVGVALVELSYVFDCADGQLARVTGRSSEVGSLLDFLMDELKAYLLVGALTVRWWLHDGGGALAFIVGLTTLVIVGCAIALTKFTRTEEYARATGTERVRHGESAGRAATSKGPLWPVMALARSVSQYPTTLPLFAAFNRLDIFVYAYGGVHLLYLGKTALVVLLRLGRFSPSDDGSRE